MAADAGGRDQSWLVEPLGARDVRIHVDVGNGVELSDEVRDALDTLVGNLFGAEVEGFKITVPGCPALKCPVMETCGSYGCRPYGSCTALYSNPCYVDVSCIIGKIA